MTYIKSDYNAIDKSNLVTAVTCNFEIVTRIMTRIMTKNILPGHTRSL